MDAACFCRIFSRQSESVPSHRVQHVATAHAFVARDDVRGRVALGMANVQSRARRIGEHIKDVVLRLRRNIIGAERALLLPEGLPLGLDFMEVVVYALGSHGMNPPL